MTTEQGPTGTNPADLAGTVRAAPPPERTYFLASTSQPITVSLDAFLADLAVPCDAFEPCAECGHRARQHQRSDGYLGGLRRAA